LLGRKFTLLSDLKALDFMMKKLYCDSKRALTRVESFLLRLEPYDFEIQYVESEANIADPLSRLCMDITEGNEISTKIFMCPLFIDDAPISKFKIAKFQKEDEEITAIISALLSGKWPARLNQFKAFRNTLAIVSGILTKDDRLVVPESLINETLELAHESHCGQTTMLRDLRASVW
jgi:hypothetical protein